MLSLLTALMRHTTYDYYGSNALFYDGQSNQLPSPTLPKQRVKEQLGFAQEMKLQYEAPVTPEIWEMISQLTSSYVSVPFFLGLLQAFIDWFRAHALKSFIIAEFKSVDTFLVSNISNLLTMEVFISLLHCSHIL